MDDLFDVFDQAPQGETTEAEEITETITEDESFLLNPPRMKVHVVETLEGCTHEVAIPPGIDYQPLKPSSSKPVRDYPFVLDAFQKEAILCLDNYQSVLVSAHTSAGKTVVAEYSIALSLRDNQRVIYTTPIKALSNQKYREFHEEFKDVGLITGDVTINPTATILIMTTEILRSMLYRGSEITREVGWVVFDEIHYMRDIDRGVVWEETLILLPDNVKFVFLSATIPNARQFAEWVAYLHKQPCHVVYTDFRPVPLQHYVFPSGGDGIHLVLDENGQFKEQNFTSAMAFLQSDDSLESKESKDKKIMRKGRGSKVETNCFKIVKLIMEKSFAPVIIFSFSRKDCEAYALQMAKLDFNTDTEKTAVSEVFNNAMDVLNEEDKKIPQVQNILPLLKRGIGIHHGGLLPILKECIEILFSVGLIKALFATETFAMGLNMPARTVLFTGLRKYDGKDFRYITSGEYIQMSGRAGRRGLDEKGIVILIVDEKVSPVVGKSIIQGSADPLNSAFHLTYNMVLNLLRVEEINPEYMLERSFFQFQNQALIPTLVDDIKRLQDEIDNFIIGREKEVSTYFKIRTKLDEQGKNFQQFLTTPEYILPYLQPGRLIKVKCGDVDFDWGVVVNFGKPCAGGSNKRISDKKEKSYEVDVLLRISSKTSKDQPTPPKEGETGVMEVIPVLFAIIQQISSVRLYLPRDLKELNKRNTVLKSIDEVKKRFPDGVPLLHPINDMNIKDEEFVDLIKSIEKNESALYSHSLHNDKDRDELIKKYAEKDNLMAKLREIKLNLKKSKSLLQMEDLHCKKRVLRRLGYCSASDVIEMKGRVACELSSADELLLTELIFHGIFGDLSPAESVALLSCFVCDEKSSDAPELAERLRGPLKKMMDIGKRIALVSKEANIEIDEELYLEQFKPFLIDVLYAWCNGSTFSQICGMTDIFEGSIIRCMRRLEELMRQCTQAARTIGNNELEAKFTEGIKLMKRDIVFAASLYL